VLSLGPAANVIKPTSLRERIAVISQQIADSYKS
jgi:hypothetical protein